ncbi:branched-chain amino acid ABC transporter permease [Glycomyces terrestris]|uniref:Branched-chain amino acid ABC transporter permease n=1 Tax=Glycomyces terrestris TaxID=2493553 RepID=A0A426US19_9ACTN|nr:branched-chain amino acid ABC transporter permease [Glycomyces terrestris]RRR95806.1 branched-chain amino acid ABC transporter permease [Glycomyces terrestris]
MSTPLRALLLTVLAIGGTFGLDPFRNYQLATAAACFAAVAGLTVLVGLTGQLSLGHAVLMAAGGYGFASAASAVDGPWPVALLAGLVAAAAASGALGLLLGAAAARLRGPYLAGLTLALVIALPAAANTLPLGGDQGVRAPFLPVPEPLAALIAVEQWHAWLAIATAAVAVTPLVMLRNGRAGLRMRAVLDDETASRLSGVDPGPVKAGAFAASAVPAGLGGAALAIATQQVTPGGYGLGFSLLLVVAAVAGGLGSIGGAAIGAVLVTVLPWGLDELAALAPDGLGRRLDGNLAVLLFGAGLIALTTAWPGGAARLLDRLRAARPLRLATPSTTTER